MRIAILGTRGIPNNYGGYEAFAEKFSVQMAQRGHAVTVFNSSLHPYQQNSYHGVEIIHCFDPENIIGTFGQFIYDLNCICVCRKRNFDVILQLGYTSSSVWSFLFPRKSVVVTNMDGLEWQRGKYSAPVKNFLKLAEKWAVQHSNCLIADNKAIKDYLQSSYNVQANFIPYGVEITTQVTEDALKELPVKPYEYNLVIARIEPENSLEMIIQGHLQAKHRPFLLIIGSIKTKYAKNLFKKYSSPKILFLGGLYDPEKLNALRTFSNIYFHGHSVGGTNPSLLEAMASSALICAHDNAFNCSVLGLDGFYFSSADDIKYLLDEQPVKQHFLLFVNNNLKKIKADYNWEKITTAYENLLNKCIAHK